MKKIQFYTTMTLLPFCLMCRNENRHLKSRVESATNNKECFMAIDGKDSAFLSLSKSADNEYGGHLSINYAKQPDDDGNFGGVFSGDTLLVNYNFYLGKDSSKTFTNPLALLKKGDSLILGSGKTETRLGRTILEKSKISFDKGRFRFIKVKCK